ncbi:MAG: alpha-D-ribose 1-methylphosphonate 5-triphosphate diphosphatase [Pseudomonadota bacterium]
MTSPFLTVAAQPPCLANARIVLADGIQHGALHLDGDAIGGITEGGAVPAGAEDMDGDLLIPGLVELHTDNLERHLEPRPKVHMPHETAVLAHDGELASCGITTVFDALRVGSIHTSGTGYGPYARRLARELLALRGAGALRIRHLIHLRAEICSETLIEEFAEFDPADRIGLVSLMDHTPGQRQFRDVSKLRDYMASKHNFSDAKFEQHVAERTALRARVGDAHEAAAVAEARRLGATIASHDDTTAAQVRHSQALGAELAEFPTTVEAAEACRDAGIRIIMGAPNLIRGGSHSGNVSAAELAERDLLDIVSSDYVPSLLLASALRLAEIWQDLPRAIRTVTQTPAEAAHLPDRGRIAPGCLADLVRVGRIGQTPVVRAVWRGGARVG